MKMQYRGVTYDRHPIPNLKPQESHNNAGMVYVRLEEKRFMGQVCKQPTVHLAIAKKATRFLGKTCSFNAIEPIQTNVTV